MDELLLEGKWALRNARMELARLRIGAGLGAVISFRSVEIAPQPKANAQLKEWLAKASKNPESIILLVFISAAHEISADLDAQQRLNQPQATTAKQSA